MAGFSHRHRASHHGYRDAVRRHDSGGGYLRLCPVGILLWYALTVAMSPYLSAHGGLTGNDGYTGYIFLRAFAVAMTPEETQLSRMIGCFVGTIVRSAAGHGTVNGVAILLPLAFALHLHLRVGALFCWRRCTWL